MDDLPSREQIALIEHVPSLELLRDDLNDAIARIEVDLEFRPGDEDWAGRARGALAAHNICFGHVSRRLHKLTRPEKPIQGPSTERIEAKANRAAAVAARQAAEAENRRAMAVEKAQAAKDRLLKHIESTNWLMHFHNAAVKQLDAKLLADITAAANSKMKGAINAAISNP